MLQTGSAAFSGGELGVRLLEQPESHVSSVRRLVAVAAAVAAGFAAGCGVQLEGLLDSFAWWQLLLLTGCAGCLLQSQKAQKWRSRQL